MADPHRVDKSTPSKGVGVAASPFNPIKFELALILAGGLMLVLLMATVIKIPGWEFTVVTVYFLAGSCWVIWRTRVLLQRLRSETHGQTQIR